MSDDTDRIRAARLAADIEAFTDSKFEATNMTPIEEIENSVRARLGKLRTRIEPIARRAYTATKAVITAPDYEEPRPKPDTTVLQKMVAWLKADDKDQ